LFKYFIAGSLLAFSSLLKLVFILVRQVKNFLTRLLACHFFLECFSQDHTLLRIPTTIMPVLMIPDPGTTALVPLTHLQVVPPEPQRVTCGD
jgi:hypothetical protein